MTYLKDIANKTIPHYNNNVELRYKDIKTSDIIKEILSTYNTSKTQTKEFSKYVQDDNILETCKNIWNFIKDNIPYKEDPLFYQYIKTPSATWALKIADCKSYSIFIASLLYNLKIPFKFRFTSYSENKNITHVYIVVPTKENEIIIDCVLPQFNTEKQYKFKKDYMTGIYKVSGTTEPVKKIINLGNKDIMDMTEGELDLWLARDRMLTEKAIVEKVKGIGSLISEKYQDSIDMLEDAIRAVNNLSGIGEINVISEKLSEIATDAVNGVYSVAEEVHALGNIGVTAKREARKKVQAKKKQIRKELTGKEKRTAIKTLRSESGTKTGKFLQKTAAKIKSGVKAVVKVLTAPQRLLAKSILEITLPKAAPFFLYLFITDTKIISKLPAKVKTKRNNAIKIKNFIVDIIGMKQSHFMAICRNGIMKKYGKSPESVIAAQTKGIKGIGVIDPATAIAIFKFLKEIISKIASVFKKKAPIDVSSNDMPDGSDWSGSDKDLLSKEILSQKDTFDTKSGEPLDGNKSIWNSLK